MKCQIMIFRRPPVTLAAMGLHQTVLTPPSCVDLRWDRTRWLNSIFSEGTKRCKENLKQELKNERKPTKDWLNFFWHLLFSHRPSDQKEGRGAREEPQHRIKNHRLSPATATPSGGGGTFKTGRLTTSEQSWSFGRHIRAFQCGGSVDPDHMTTRVKPKKKVWKGLRRETGRATNV